MNAFPSIHRIAQWVVSMEVWVLVVLAAGSVVTDRLLLVGVLAAAAFWPLRWLARGRLSVRTPLDLPICALVLLLPVTLLATPLPEITRPQVYRLLLGMGLCYALANHNWSLPKLRAVIMYGSIGLAFGLSLVSLVSVEWVVEKLVVIPIGLLSNLHIFMNEQGQSNVIAGSLVLMVLFGPAWLLFGGQQIRWWGWLLLLAIAAFSVAVLVLTRSHGEWLGLAAATAVLLILRWPRWAALVLIVAALAGGVLLASRPDFVQVLMQGYDTGADFSGLQSRLDVWKQAVTQIKAFPLTGMGMGTFPQVSRALYPSALVVLGDNLHVHNLYLQIAIDLGLPGLAAWFGIAGVVAGCAWQVYRAGLRQVGWLAGLGAGLLAAQTALAVHGLVDAVTWGTRPAILVWGLWGLALAAWILVQDQHLDHTCAHK